MPGATAMSCAPEGDAPSVKILVVDDQAAILDLMRSYLGQLGYEVSCASEREEAEALLECRSFDLLIADLGLGRFRETDGLDLVTFARYRCADVKVLVLSGQDAPTYGPESRRRGAGLFLSKPQPLPRLAEAIAELLETEVVP